MPSRVRRKSKRHSQRRALSGEWTLRVFLLSFEIFLLFKGMRTRARAKRRMGKTGTMIVTESLELRSGVLRMVFRARCDARSRECARLNLAAVRAKRDSRRINRNTEFRDATARRRNTSLLLKRELSSIGRESPLRREIVRYTAVAILRIHIRKLVSCEINPEIRDANEDKRSAMTARRCTNR